MRKFLPVLIAVFLLVPPMQAFAKSYEVNPFYAIRSYPEYEKVQNILGDTNSIYYGWSRIARDMNGNMIFTDYKAALSKYDTYSNDYSMPETVDGKLTNDINKALHPDSRSLLMVFLNRITDDDGRDSIVDFLNMGTDAWKKNIIDPLAGSITSHRFDGVVLDIEGIADSINNTNYTSAQTSNLKAKYGAFLSELKKGLQGKRLVVCVNMPEFGGYDYPYIYNIADQIIFLAYPYQHYNTYGQSDGVPDLAGKIKEVDVPEAEPYRMIKKDVEDITSILKEQYGPSYNPEKILLGTTLEINGWIEKEYTYQSKAYTYFERTSSLDSGSQFKINTLQGIQGLNAPEEYVSISPVYKYESKTYKKVLTSGLDSGMKKIEYYYDTAETIYEKYYTLVSDYSFEGISVWRMGLGDYNTDESIWASMNNLFGIYKGEFDEIPYATDVVSDKAWTVKFNIPLNETTIKSAKDNIAIVDAYGKIVPVNYSYDKGTNSVKVSPSSAYKQGSLYYLIIGKNIKSESGSQLNKPVIMRFKVK